MLAGGHENFRDAAGNGRIDIGLHFHGFESEKFCAAFHDMVHLHGDAADHARRRRRDLPWIGRSGPRVSALHPPKRAIANADFAGLAGPFEKERARAIWKRVAYW